MSCLHFLCSEKQAGAMKKMETFSPKEPSAWEFFVIFFLHACPHFFNSDIRKVNRRSHVKLYNILFFKKEKMK